MWNNFKIGLLLLLSLGVIGFVSSAYYVTDPNNCPTEYQSQTCSGSDVVCGYSGGVTFCYDPSGINPPSVDIETSTTNYACSDTACDGGFVIDCYYYDGSAPHCDNGNTGFCDRSSACYNVHRKTQCTKDVFVTSTCTTCISGYNYCDGSYTDADGCEIQTGSTNCEAGAYNHYNSSCECECDTNYLDCDGGGANSTNGCEVHDGASCTVGSISGTYDGCTCVVDKSYFETGTFIEYLTGGDQYAMLWFKNYGDNATINATDKNNVSFIVNETGVYWNGSKIGLTGEGETDTNCSVSGSCPNIIYWDNESDLSANDSLYWNGANETNDTQFVVNLGILSIDLTWLVSYLNDWFGGKTTDDLGEGSINLYDNKSWNESKANTLYATINEPLWSGNDSDVARTGDCPSGQYVQNTTTGGVECSTFTGTNCSGDQSCENLLYESDLPLGNRTLVQCDNITGAISDLCTLVDTNTGNTTEEMQDAVGEALDGNFTYNDAGDSITVNPTGLSNTLKIIFDTLYRLASALIGNTDIEANAINTTQIIDETILPEDLNSAVNDSMDSRYVNINGDTMTETLNISDGNLTLSQDKYICWEAFGDPCFSYIVFNSTDNTTRIA